MLNGQYGCRGHGTLQPLRPRNFVTPSPHFMGSWACSAAWLRHATIDWKKRVAALVMCVLQPLLEANWIVFLVFLYWLVVSTPLKNMNVNWDNYSQLYMGKQIQTTNQFLSAMGGHHMVKPLRAVCQTLCPLVAPHARYMPKSSDPQPQETTVFCLVIYFKVKKERPGRFLLTGSWR